MGILYAVGAGLVVATAVWLVQAVLHGGRFGRWATYYVIALAALLCVGLVYSVLLVVTRWLGDIAQGSSQLSISAALVELLALAGVSGLLAYLLVEFIKRTVPVRPIFNRREVVRFFGADINELNERARREMGHEPSGTDVPGPFLSDISYGGTSRQLVAQLSEAVRSLMSFGLRGFRPTESRGELDYRLISEILRVSLGDQAMRGYEFAAYFGRARDSDRGASAQFGSAVDESIERRLDAFQIGLTNRWQLLMRTSACAVAGLFAGTSSSVFLHSAPGIALATVTGAALGGPISWLLRDASRLIERRASL